MSWDPSDDILLKQLKEEQRLGWKEIATHCKISPPVVGARGSGG